MRVQDRIKTAPAKDYTSIAAYNMTKSVTSDTSTASTRKDKPRDPLWCRFSYWPRVNFNSNAVWAGLSSNADRANSAVIPVDNLNSDTLISNFEVGDITYPIKVWSGCPLYKIDDEFDKAEVLFDNKEELPMKTVQISLNSIDKVKSFVNDITKFDYDFDLVSGRYVIDAKSIMGIFSLDLSKPIDLNIHAEENIDDVMAILKNYTV